MLYLIYTIYFLFLYIFFKPAKFFNMCPRYNTYGLVRTLEYKATYRPTASMYLAREKIKITIVKEKKGEKIEVNAVDVVLNALSIHVLKIVCEALMTLQAAASLSFVAFFLVNAGDVSRRQFVMNEASDPGSRFQ